MTKLVFTYAGTHNPDGRYATHLYIKQMEPDYDQMPGSELKAAADAQKIVSDLINVNVAGDPERLVRGGEIPADAVPVCWFEVCVSWDRKHRLPSYRSGEYCRLRPEAMWNPVASLMMEQRAYIVGVLKKRVRDELRAREERRAEYARRMKS